MRTNATYLYRSAPGVTLNCLRVNLLLHNKKKCDLVANSGEVVSPAILVRLSNHCSLLHHRYSM